MNDNGGEALLLTDKTHELYPEAVKQQLQALQKMYADVLGTNQLVAARHTPEDDTRLINSFLNPWIKILVATMLSRGWRDARIEDTLREFGIHISRITISVHRHKSRKIHGEKMTFENDLLSSAQSKLLSYGDEARGRELLDQLQILATRIAVFCMQENDKTKYKIRSKGNGRVPSLRSPEQPATIATSWLQNRPAAQPAPVSLLATPPSAESINNFQGLVSYIFSDDGVVALRIINSIRGQIADIWTWGDIESDTGVPAASLLLLTRELLRRREISSARELPGWLQKELDKRRGEN